MYPAGIHYALMFVSVQILAIAVIFLSGFGLNISLFSASVWGSAVSGLLMIPIGMWLMKKDDLRRNPLMRERGEIDIFVIFWMLALGASLAYIFNMLIGIANLYEIFPHYSETTKDLYTSVPGWALLLCVGIVAPVAEEVVFRGLIYQRLKDYAGVRWAIVLSAVFFGVYHGNMIQAIYASALGILFAWLMEYFQNLWVPILLHMGGNTWCLIFSTYAVKWVKVGNGIPVMLVIGLQFVVVFFSAVYLASTWKVRKHYKSGRW